MLVLAGSRVASSPLLLLGLECSASLTAEVSVGSRFLGVSSPALFFGTCTDVTSV